jgi:hypothetical protein
MARWFLKSDCGVKWSLLSSFLTFAAIVAAMVLSDTRPISALPVNRVLAIPAFARKYDLPCSACHTAWPELNSFGQNFRDNGYQLMNDKDSPIWQNPSYIPITIRVTPNVHFERTNHQLLDPIPGQPSSSLMEGTVTSHGFDLSGMDIWFAGTLYKNISFSVLPSSDAHANFHFENAFIRFDNLKSRWLNLKVGKFELDNMVSEKRFLFLSGNGGLYQTYHFVPAGDSNDFALGANQIGAELSGHSENSYTRYSVSVLSSNNGNVGLPGNRGYDTYVALSQAFDAGKIGLERIGVYAYLGQRPTYYQTSTALGTTPDPTTTPPTAGTTVNIAGNGLGNKPFYRVGFNGNLSVGKLELLPFFMHARDSAFLATSPAPGTPPPTPANQPLQNGARDAVWNGGFLETHFHLNPQFVLTQRTEVIRMAQQALPTTASDLGNIDAYSVGYRWYPFMYSRVGLAWHNEYSITKTHGMVPLGGGGIGQPPQTPSTPVWSQSVFMGFDFAF